MIRFAVIGTNWITDRFLQAGEGAADFTCTAVYSRSAEKVRHLPKNTGLIQFLRTYIKWRKVMRLMPCILQVQMPFIRSRPC